MRSIYSFSCVWVLFCSLFAYLSVGVSSFTHLPSRHDRVDLTSLVPPRVEYHGRTLNRRTENQEEEIVASDTDSQPSPRVNERPPDEEKQTTPRPVSPPHPRGVIKIAPDQEDGTSQLEALPLHHGGPDPALGLQNQALVEANAEQLHAQEIIKTAKKQDIKSQTLERGKPRLMPERKNLHDIMLLRAKTPEHEHRAPNPRPENDRGFLWEGRQQSRVRVWDGKKGHLVYTENEPYPDFGWKVMKHPPKTYKELSSASVRKAVEAKRREVHQTSPLLAANHRAEVGADVADQWRGEDLRFARRLAAMRVTNDLQLKGLWGHKKLEAQMSGLRQEFEFLSARLDHFDKRLGLSRGRHHRAVQFHKKVGRNVRPLDERSRDLIYREMDHWHAQAKDISRRYRALSGTPPPPCIRNPPLSPLSAMWSVGCEKLTGHRGRRSSERGASALLRDQPRQGCHQSGHDRGASHRFARCRGYPSRRRRRSVDDLEECERPKLGQ